MKPRKQTCSRCGNGSLLGVDEDGEEIRCVVDGCPDCNGEGCEVIITRRQGRE